MNEPLSMFRDLEPRLCNDHQDDRALALKRDLVSDGYVAGHSCEHCKIFKMQHILHQEQRREKFFSIDTTRAEVQRVAEDGCLWWSMFHDQVRYADLRVKGAQIMGQGKVEIAPDEYYTDNKAITNGMEEVEKDLPRFHRNIWGMVRMGDWDRPIQDPNFVQVSLGYSMLNDFQDRPVMVEVNLDLPEVRTSPWIVGLARVRYFAKFLVFSLPDVTDKLDINTCISCPVNLYPGSSKAFELARHWLMACESKHKCSLWTSPQVMPRMLLRVGGLQSPNKVNLVQTPGMKERYIALSYCWGSYVQKTILTEANKSKLLDGIELSSFDSTIQDAIRVTRELGFDFLWIDALCIPQDSVDEKAREIARMAEIYENATLTIIASRASSVKEGFLSNRRPAGEADLKHVFQLAYENHKHRGAEDQAILMLDELDEPEPWDGRAWTLQEHLLSKRILQYGTRQTKWTCYGSKKPFEACDGWVRGKGHAYKVLADKELFDEVSWKMKKTKGTANEARWQWYDLVRVYSARFLTYKTDRLRAISSFARKFSSIFNDQYVCGHWKAFLPHELLWYPNSNRTLTFSPGPKLQPSWSWASYEGGVTIRGKYTQTHVDDDFQVLESQVELESSHDPFGAVKTAFLKVRGLICDVDSELLDQKTKWESAEESNLKPCDSANGEGSAQVASVERSSARDPDSASFEQFLETSLDDKINVSSDHPPTLSLLIIGYYLSCQGARENSGLILISHGEERFSRIGTFSIRNIWATSLQAIDPTHRSEEEYRARLRQLWGGEENIRQITLI